MCLQLKLLLQKAKKISKQLEQLWWWFFFVFIFFSEYIS